MIALLTTVAQTTTESSGFIFSENGIAFMGILLTLLVSICGGIFSILNYLREKKLANAQLELTRKQLAVDTITTRRVEWMNTLRNCLADYITLVDYFCNKTFQEADNEFVENIQALQNVTQKITLLLNFKGDIDQVVLNNIIELNKKINPLLVAGKTREELNTVNKEITPIISSLIIHSRIYLKFEWIRVNKETHIEDFSEELQIEELKKLYSYYSEKKKNERIKLTTVSEMIEFLNKQ